MVCIGDYKMIGNFCRRYRMSKNVSLAKLAGKTNYKTLYSFETERSTNYNHIKPYLKLADDTGDTANFIIGLLKELRDNG